MNNYSQLSLLLGKYIQFAYVNYRGEFSVRQVEFKNIVFGSNDYHDSTFLIIGRDLEKDKERSFDIRNIRSEITIIN